jgi:hypothetical protein
MQFPTLSRHRNIFIAIVDFFCVQCPDPKSFPAGWSLRVFRRFGHDRLRRSAVLFLTFSLVGSVAMSAEIRKWTDTTGKHTREASFEQFEDDAVVLVTKDGKLLRIRFDRLSATDQDYARKAASRRDEQDPFEPLENTKQAHRGSSTVAADPAEVRVVVAKGVGVSVEEAKKDAYREAVRQVAGAFVEGDTLVRNDEVIEDKVLVLSGALVQRADVIPESVSSSDGLTRLRIRAEVRVTEVMKSLARVNVTTTGVRSSSVEGQVVTLADQTESAELAIGDPKAWNAVPASFFVMKLVGEPQVLKARGDDVTLQLLLQLSPDRDQYMAFAHRLAAVLSRLDGPKGSFRIDGLNPNVEQDRMKEACAALWKHTLLSSRSRGNLAEPEISYAFPPAYREQLKAYFGEMGESVTSKSQCAVYCFNQSEDGSFGCGLEAAAMEWNEALGGQSEDRVILCLLMQANEGFNRTRWDWFACDRSLFPEGKNSPWLRSIECEVILHGNNGEQITSDVIPLTGGFGLSCAEPHQLPVMIISPFWVDTGGTWPEERYSYVPQFTFPRRLDLTAKEAAAISEARCVVRPRVNKPD